LFKGTIRSEKIILKPRILFIYNIDKTLFRGPITDDNSLFQKI